MSKKVIRLTESEFKSIIEYKNYNYEKRNSKFIYI